MIVGIHQPNYIPWIGYFYKIYKSDIFVVLDDVQYVKNSFADRNKIKTPQGDCYLKAPVEVKSAISKYCDVRLKDELKWREKHLKTIEMNYKKSSYFKEVFEDLYEIYNSKEVTILGEFNSLIIEYAVKKLDINTEIIYSKDLNVDMGGTDRLLEIIKKCGGTKYLSGKGGAKYQDENEFKKNNIELLYTDFKHPVYEQLWGEFIPNLSILDLLFNYGEESLNIIKKSYDN